MATLLNPSDVKWIVLHCSASSYGDVETIDNWHKQQGWLGCGYHYVICNCFPKYDNWKWLQPELGSDGVIQRGRAESFVGAHVRGHNWETIGICMVGTGGIFTSRQLESAAKLYFDIAARFPNIIGIKGHYEFNKGKTCPDLDMDYFRKYLLKET